MKQRRRGGNHNLSGAKASPDKAAEAAYLFPYSLYPGRRTAGLKTLREGRVNAAKRTRHGYLKGRVNAAKRTQLPIANNSGPLPPKTSDQPLVNLARHAHVVEVVFANLGQFAGLIEVEDLATFDFPGLAGFDPQRPRDVVETDPAAPIAQPPGAHRVVHATHVVFTEIDEWPRCDAVNQAALKDERQIESDDVVAHDLVTV